MNDIIRRFKRNTRGRDLIVGDVHGCFDKLRLTLRSIGFDPDAGDRLFSVGDLVDRGPQSDHAIQWLCRPWFHAVRGNHEQMALEFVEGTVPGGMLVANGGMWLIAEDDLGQREEFAAAFRDMPLVIEIETLQGLVAIVHAGCLHPTWEGFKAALSGPDPEPTMRVALWSRDRADGRYEGRVEGLRALVVGHTPLDEAQWADNVLHIDTGGWQKGGRTQRRITVVDAASLMCLQSEATQPDWSAVL